MGTSYEEGGTAVNGDAPVPPPLPTTSSTTTVINRRAALGRKSCCVSADTKESWDRLFDDAYRADVSIHTSSNNIIYAHASILGLASPVFRSMFRRQSKRKGSFVVPIPGVPTEAVRVFIRFLYSSCYEEDQMQEHGLSLLVLSHSFVVPRLKRECEYQIESKFLNIENVVDRQKEKVRKMKERKVYLELYEAMEALVHICRDGCRTIGPYDKALNERQEPCKYEACKGLEALIRHFAGCKLRVPGGCVHCKRMWQLLELHSRLCADSDVCRVPLCKNFKEKTRRQKKKDDIMWKILVRKILRTKSITGAPYFSMAESS